MIDFPKNFANDMLTPADFSYIKTFRAWGVCFGEEWENTLTFKSNILSILSQD